MTGQEPEGYDEFINQVRPFMAAILGEEGFASLLRESTADMATFVDTPRTWQAKLGKSIQQALAGLNSDDLLEKLSPYMQEMMATTVALRHEQIARETELARSNEGAWALVAVVRGATAQQKSLILDCIIRAQGDGGIERILESSSGMGRLIAKGASDPESIGFEEHAIALATQIAHIAERFYKPLLSAALQVTRIEAGKEGALPTMLGGLMRSCRKEWPGERSALLSLLDDRVRIARNSEAHRSTLIDVEAEAVTFVNARPEGTIESLGPLTRLQLGELISATLHLCLSLEAALNLAKREIQGI